MWAPAALPLVENAQDATAAYAAVNNGAAPRLLRRIHGPGARIVVLAHNGHIQRVPFEFLPGISAPSAGTYLAQDYGRDYCAIGVTALTGTTTGLNVDETRRHGIAVHAEPLDDPAPDSIERAVMASGAAAEPVLLDLRPARGRTHSPRSIRHATTHIRVDVLAGYDALYCLPHQQGALLATRSE